MRKRWYTPRVTAAPVSEHVCVLGRRSVLRPQPVTVGLGRMLIYLQCHRALGSFFSCNLSRHNLKCTVWFCIRPKSKLSYKWKALSLCPLIPFPSVFAFPNFLLPPLDWMNGPLEKLRGFMLLFQLSSLCGSPLHPVTWRSVSHTLQVGTCDDVVLPGAHFLPPQLYDGSPL